VTYWGWDDIHRALCRLYQGELLAFEKQKQAELRAEIQRLSEELDDNKDERDAELKGMLNAFSVRHGLWVVK